MTLRYVDKIYAKMFLELKKQSLMNFRAFDEQSKVILTQNPEKFIFDRGRFFEKCGSMPTIRYETQQI